MRPVSSGSRGAMSPACQGGLRSPSQCATSSASQARASSASKRGLRFASPRGVSCPSQRGMSLIECLVALVVLAVGMMGTATLILEGLRNAHVALLRTQAVILVSDMIERIRANPGAGGAYDCASYPAGPAQRACAATDAADAVTCTPDQLAEDDLARWHNSARTALPLEDAPCAANVIYAPAAASDEADRYRVAVSWRTRGALDPLTYESELLVSPP